MPLNYCCVRNCSNGKDTKKCYRIPKTPCIQQEWFHRISRPDLKSKNHPENYLVCEDHFSQDCFTPHRTLLKRSLPTLKLPEYCPDENSKVFFETSAKKVEARKGALDLEYLDKLPKIKVLEEREELELQVPTRTYGSKKEIRTSLVLEEACESISSNETHTSLVPETLSSIPETVGMSNSLIGGNQQNNLKNVRDIYVKHPRPLNKTTNKDEKQKFSVCEWEGQMKNSRLFLTIGKTTSNTADSIGPAYNDSESLNSSNQQSEKSPPTSRTMQNENGQNIPKTNSKKRKKLNDETEICGPTEKKVKKRTRNKNSLNTSNKCDDLDLIFSGYAKIVKKFSPRLQINAKLKFAQLMAELEYQHEQETFAFGQGVASFKTEPT